MDKIEKALNKLSDKEKKIVQTILEQLHNKQLRNLDIKKLKGRNDIYRVRKGKIRIIYRIDDLGKIFILAIERRTDTTYNF